MNYQQAIEFFLLKPSYLKAGVEHLAHRFKVDLRILTEARQEAIRLLKEDYDREENVPLYTLIERASAELLPKNRTTGQIVEEELVIDYETSIHKSEEGVKVTCTTGKSIIETDLYKIFDIDPKEYTLTNFWAKSHKKGQHTYSGLFKKAVSEVAYGEAFQDFIKSYVPSIEKTKPVVTNDPLLSLIAVFDSHIGKTPLVNTSNYYDTLPLQQARFRDNIDYLLGVNPFPVSQFLFVIGNDFLNCELNKTTTKGTPQETNDPLGMYRLGLTLLVEAIDKMKRVAPVHVLLIPGNHAFNLESIMAISLAQIYTTDPLITFDFQALDRKYYRWNNILLGFGHGELTMEEYAKLMPVEKPLDYATTLYKEVYLGDKHTEKSCEYKGTLVRHLGGITGTDAWHYQKGYVGNRKRSYNILFKHDMKFCEFSYIE